MDIRYLVESHYMNNFLKKNNALFRLVVIVIKSLALRINLIKHFESDCFNNDSCGFSLSTGVTKSTIIFVKKLWPNH